MGERLGRFVVVGSLGAGAMGAVYAAYDPKLERRVAIKVLQREGSAKASARIEREARSMARLNHPNVVAVYDVGEFRTGLYIAMEYVEGTTLASWQDGKGRDQLLDAYRQAALGLAAAHHVGLVHRDFKPDNVMVAPGRERAIVKVVDFGLASVGDDGVSTDDRAMETARSRSQQRLTGTGRVLGTPAYMAPEQFMTADVDAGADQFAFCVALWEALAGAPPFAGRSVNERLGAIVREELVAAPRTSLMKGWVATILQRGLRPKPADRWSSMDDLIAALDRDPGRVRRRWAVMMGATVTVGALGWWGTTKNAELCTGATEHIAAVWGSAERERVGASIESVSNPIAARVSAHAVDRLDRYADAWASMHTEACEATAVRGEQSGAVMDLRMSCLSDARDELRETVQVLAEVDETVLPRVRGVVLGLPELERCADVGSLRAGGQQPPSEERELVASLRALLARAAVLNRAGRHEDVLALAKEAERGAESASFAPIKTDISLTKGVALERLGDYDAAEREFMRTLELAARSNQRPQMGRAAGELLGLVGERKEQVEESLRYLGLARALSADEPAAEAAFRNTYANLLSVQGKFGEAEKEQRRVLDLRIQLYGPHSPEAAWTRSAIASLVGEQGRYEEAEELFEDAIADFVSAFGEFHPDIGMVRNNFHSTLREQGRTDEAVAQLEKALAIFEATLPGDHPHLLGVRTNLAMSWLRQGRTVEAESALRAAVEGWTELLGENHSNVATSRIGLADALRDQGRLGAAEREYRAAMQIWTELSGPEHPRAASARSHVAALLLARGRVDDAVEEAEAAWRAQHSQEVPPDAQGRAAFILAQALWAAGPPKRDRARPMALVALERTRRAYGDADTENRTREIEDWLEEHPAR